MQEKFKITPDLYASQGQRLANMFIDFIIYYIFIILISMVLAIILGLIGGVELLNSIVDSTFFNLLVTYGSILLYFILFEYFLQKTVGKYISKTIVVNKFGEQPKLSQIVGRTFARMIPFDAFSFLGANARGWHDTLPEVFVVDEKLFKQKKTNFYDFNQLGKNDNDRYPKDTQETLEVRF
ncbi:MAG TPA: RDD family protein [Flavobacteriia bacterium]|nr:RDD family protein [Flavobacteriia bacterium]